MSPLVYVIIAAVPFVAFLVWMIARTIQYEKTKRREGKDAAAAHLAEQDEQVEKFFAKEGARHPVLYHVLSGVVFLGAVAWLSTTIWKDISVLESGRVDSVVAWRGTAFLYNQFGALTAKMLFPFLGGAYLLIWFTGLQQKLSAGTDAAADGKDGAES